MRRWTIRSLLAVLVATAALFGSAAPVAAGSGPPPADEVEPAWFGGGPITLYVLLPGDPNGPPPAPDPALPAADVFLIAPVDAAHPQDPGVVIPSPPAPFPIVVPVHDTVVATSRPYAWRANCFGVQVLPGPAATARTVLTRPDPNGGATLAYALRFGARTVPLTSAAVIAVGARLGLLTLDRSWPGYGGTCWTGRPRR
ncbi:hypothetical protein ACFO1B_40770 [Dactylosporangium siamense]|uniref:Secreted protein n=1 Tax=Dactylosporangium siamense TaxID=685454 RepID=A0A919PHC6_9ACTN|nr:hypothetical protein [Dactylosporangium siamense]GIG42590.1 hypothetical protein Dsi01nite_006310 [Dactylosporangium siamense]